MATQQPGPGKKKTARKKTTTKRSTKTTSTSAKKKTKSTAKRTGAPKTKKSQPKPAALTVTEVSEVTPFPPIVSWQRRQEMIAEAAYYKAERRGFAGGDSAADWNEAEAEIDAMLATREV